ncbi:MAG: peroxide stress protein YaaA [Gammaproteobacteria bacterium]|nr:peroxide stress protein YaaA [Gammaproteobacteria bacterium]
MLTVISPAKTLDFVTPSTTSKHTHPDFLDHSSELIKILKQHPPKKLKQLMKISDKLAELNAQRFRDWHLPFTRENAKQAILAFKGEVYLGLEAEDLNTRDLNFAQKHLRILSGLYGLLKPLDLIQPYRLEMGAKLKNQAGDDLYQFWGNHLSASIEKELTSHNSRVLVNLASLEYFKSLNGHNLSARVINPVFKDYSNGSYRVLSFFAKKARGFMANYIIRNRINQAEDLKAFKTDGYKYNKTLSNEDQWVFTRKPAIR